MRVQLGLEVVGFFCGAQRGFGAIFRALALQLWVAPLCAAASHGTLQHRVAGVDVVVLELWSLVMGMDASHDVSSF